jgi:anti-sigma regulatory factor (Ser/Thr protein kinase)
MCESTPRTERELPISREAPSMAREFLRQATCPEHHIEVLEDAVLLVSELVTNSVLHGGPPVVVAVDCDGEALRVRVRDGSPSLPELRHAQQVDEGGRGLELVANLSQDWGVDPVEDGKHVWFVLRKPA